jgi:hypothetical protein
MQTVKPTPLSVQQPKLTLLADKTTRTTRTRKAGSEAGLVARRSKCLAPVL